VAYLTISDAPGAAEGGRCVGPADWFTAGQGGGWTAGVEASVRGARRRGKDASARGWPYSRAAERLLEVATGLTPVRDVTPRPDRRAIPHACVRRQRCPRRSRSRWHSNAQRRQ